MNNLNVNQQKNRPSRKGNLNPMWGRKHSQQSKDLMKSSHRAYQERIRQAQQQKPMTMDEFLGNNPQLDIKGYIKSLMKQENFIREIIKEEIEKLL